MNPTQKKAYMKEWRAKNREKIRAYNATYMPLYYEENKERLKPMMRDYYKLHKKEIIARATKFDFDNPEQRRNRVRLRRAKKKKAQTGDQKLLVRWEKSVRSKPFSICFWCRKRVKTKSITIDHIVAISVGGPHCIENVCVACSSCNENKNAKSVERWNATLSEPILL